MSLCVICIFLNMIYKFYRIVFEINIVVYNIIVYYKIFIWYNIEYGMI